MSSDSDISQTSSVKDSQHSSLPNERSRSVSLQQLSDDEKRVLKECERESFFLRALPLSLGAMAGAHYMVQTGRWSGHPRFRSIPKMIITGGFGYFCGKISYLSTCQQKVLQQIPNSNLAAAIRKSKGLSQPEVDQLAPVTDDSVAVSDKYHEYSPSAGIDDRFRPSMDREVKEPTEKQDKNSITYDELRRRNRKEFEDASRPHQKTLPPASSPYKDSPFIPEKHLPREPLNSEFDSQEEIPQAPPKRGKKTTVWGDVIED